MVDDHWEAQGRQEHGWFGHGTSASTIVKAAASPPNSDGLPTSGLASTYADKFVGHPVAGFRRGAQFGVHKHEGYTAALLGQHRGVVPFGTHLLLQYGSKRVISSSNGESASVFSYV